MLTSLTPEQEARLPEFRDKWIKIGLCTDTIDFEKATAAVHLAYKCAELEPPREIRFSRSPKECIEQQMEEHQKRDISITKNECAQHQVYGFSEAPWLSIYDFYIIACEVEGLDAIQGLIEVAKTCGWWAPYDEMAFVQDRPQEIHIENSVLHKDLGPAISYRDGYAIYALNGIKMPEWAVLTPAEGIDPLKALELENAQMRAEVIRKVGVERLVYKLNPTVVDKNDKGTYELLDLRDAFRNTDTLDPNRPRFYLKMKNPSVDLWHVEGVPSECDTIEKALTWRKPPEMAQIKVDDENGQDWFQQGDVCVWPGDAKSLKANPAVLT